MPVRRSAPPQCDQQRASHRWVAQPRRSHASWRGHGRGHGRWRARARGSGGAARAAARRQRRGGVTGGVAARREGEVGRAWRRPERRRRRGRRRRRRRRRRSHTAWLAQAAPLWELKRGPNTPPLERWCDGDLFGAHAHHAIVERAVATRSARGAPAASFAVVLESARSAVPGHGGNARWAVREGGGMGAVPRAARLCARPS